MVSIKPLVYSCRFLFSQPTIKSVLKECVPKENVNVCGWISTKRKSKYVTFMEINDGTAPKGIQCIVNHADSTVDLINSSLKLSTGCCVTVNGSLVASGGKGQDKEMIVNSIRLFGACDSIEYPIQKKRHSLEFLRSHFHLRMRSRLFHSIQRIRHSLLDSIHTFFHQNEFLQSQTPVITSQDCEGGGEVFQLLPQSSLASLTSKDDISEIFSNFFNSNAYLSVSSQLYLESLAHSFSRVYTISPCFRADPGSKESTRHLAEFYMVEAEWSFPGVHNSDIIVREEQVTSGLVELCDIAEALLKRSLRAALDTCTDELLYLDADRVIRQGVNGAELSSRLASIKKVTESPITRLTYSHAIEIITRAQSEERIKFHTRITAWGQSLQAEHERFLCEWSVREDPLSSGCVIVMNYPASCKPFYMRSNTSSQSGRETVACFDLLIPEIGELFGGSIREERYSQLKQKLTMSCKENPSTLSQYSWYLDLRKFGSSPHGGFGMGLERLLMYICGMENIRDVVVSGRWKESPIK